MKILYSIQATGNGHISRAMELLPHLYKYGEVDIFLSGANSTLTLDAPIKYRSRGLSLYYTCKGTLDRWKLLRNLEPLRISREVKDLPVEKYDLVLNDFECITAMACASKKVRSVQFGHQASFQSSKTPRPENKSRIGEWVLLNYARATTYIGLHFDRYDDFILPPVIKKGVTGAEPFNAGHICVYLPSYCMPQLLQIFGAFPDHHFEIFAWQVTEKKRVNNITFLPVTKEGFTNSMISCHGLITGGGFETPAEALYLRKRLIAVPIVGQYEQQCNAAALRKIGVRTLDKIDDSFASVFNGWVNEPPPSFSYSHTTEDIVHKAMSIAMNPSSGPQDEYTIKTETLR
jgi:uncharacterized protein (TIGR00661 family)